MSQSGQNKSKNRLGLKLRIPEEKDMKEEKNKLQSEQVAQPVSQVVFDDSENNVEKPALSPGQFQPGLVFPDCSPYGLFGNSRLSGGTIQSTDSLGNALKGFNYLFPQNGSMNMNIQGINLGEYEERMDSSKMNAFLNGGQQINDQQCFNFEEERNGQDDINRMNTNIHGFINAELPMLRPNCSNEINFYEMNFGNFAPEGLDYQNYYNRIDTMAAPRKSIRQD